uniref:Arogenate dehydrogenase n=1 Tax=uncultured bacterium esnapd26 TaxID=1366607 RepID=S5TNG2_9BACT|nr:arogenate dehydrogenase [uncultured bacterium esnapd26]
MVVVMSVGATAEDLAVVVETVRSVGCEGFVGRGVSRTIVGDPARLGMMNPKGHRGVAEVAGTTLLRGDAVKPRTSPYACQGPGEKALKILAAVRAETGLPVVTEAIAPVPVGLVASYADMLQVGARNQQNSRLLEAVGSVDRPVLLERVDPSHGGGRRDLVVPPSRAAGADGPIVDVHAGDRTMRRRPGPDGARPGRAGPDHPVARRCAGPDGSPAGTAGLMERPTPLDGGVLIVGAGLIGTSIGLALTASGVSVLLDDRDPGALRTAIARGAGVPFTEGDRAELAVVAVPPDEVAETLCDVQKRGLARFFTDVASVKDRPIAEAVKLGCAMDVFVGGHPMGGRERSGPEAATGDLFRGRSWVLCPTAETAPEALAAVESLAAACGARPSILAPEDHDRAVALVSHTPHVLASAMAARFADAPASFLALIGQGGRDVTRIAAADPVLWRAILSANGEAVADLVELIAADLARTAADLRAGPASVDAGAAVRQLLSGGAAGHARLP